MTMLRSLTLAGVCAPLLLAGCGPKLVPVKGTIRIDGKPAPHAFVLFTPEDPEGKPAHGSADADGVFHLMTFRAKDGAIPGEYKMTVAYSEAAPVAAKGRSPAEVQQAQQEAPLPTRVLPSTYTQIDRTVLKHRIPDDGDVKLDLETVEP
jgi:hypothetical protein